MEPNRTTPDKSAPSGGCIVWTDPDRMGGIPCFIGTRVPVRVLFDNLAERMTIDEIAGDYPTLSRKLIFAALAEAARLLEAGACQVTPAKYN
jgi:uncharacterized protein (DUF433 family)